MIFFFFFLFSNSSAVQGTLNFLPCFLFCEKKLYLYKGIASPSAGASSVPRAWSWALTHAIHFKLFMLHLINI